MNEFLKSLIQKFSGQNLTFSRGNADISKTREVLLPPIREVTNTKPITDSFSCPYCFSRNFQKRGLRAKKLEKVQLYLCKGCGKTFTPHLTKGKHYPLAVMLDALSVYNLGYSLEETCRKINGKQIKPAGGSEFPAVTEQASVVSRTLGSGNSGTPYRGSISPLASTFSGDGLSTNILSPKVSSATPADDYQSKPSSAKLSSINSKEQNV